MGVIHDEGQHLSRQRLHRHSHGFAIPLR